MGSSERRCMHLISGLPRCLLPSPASSSPHFPADADRHRQQHSRHSRCSLPTLIMKVNKFRHSKPPTGRIGQIFHNIRPGRQKQPSFVPAPNKISGLFQVASIRNSSNRKTQITPGSTGERQEAKERKKKYHANPTEKSYTSTSIYIHPPVPDT